MHIHNGTNVDNFIEQWFDYILIIIVRFPCRSRSLKSIVETVPYYTQSVLTKPRWWGPPDWHWLNNHTMQKLSALILYLLDVDGISWYHYLDVIMTTMASQITSLTVVYSTDFFRRRWKKTSKLRVTGLCEGISTVTGEFPAQRASYAENVSIWWRHHVKWSCQLQLG